MKNYKLLIILITLLFVSSCMEDYNERYLLKDYFVEFEEATSSSRAVGKDYVISKGQIKPNNKILIQVNLVGPQFSSDQLVKYQVVADQTTAIQGKDYQIESLGDLVFKANTSIATIEVSPTTNGTGETILVLQLMGNNIIKSSKNYEKIAIRCVYP